MFATIRRHQKWLWAIIIVLVIISFVIFMGPNAGSGGGRSAGPQNFGSINGRELSREELLDLHEEVRIRFRLYYNQWPEQLGAQASFFDPNRLVQERLVMLEKARELNIQVDAAAEADWIANTFRNPDTGVFDRKLLDSFVENVLAQGNTSKTALRRLARNEVAIQEVMALASIPGTLVTPGEAETEFRRTHETLSTEIASFSLSNYLATVIIEPEALNSYYTNNASRYRDPERIQVDYVAFYATNFLDQADQFLSEIEALNERVDLIYQNQDPESFRSPDGTLLTAEAAKQQIRESMQQEVAMVEARKAAALFLQDLWNRYQQTNDLGNLAGLAEEKNLSSSTSLPFARFERVPMLNVPPGFAQEVFDLKLSPENPMATEPLLGDDAAYVVTFRELSPSVVPPLDLVRLRATADLRRQLALDAARQAGESFRTNLIAGLAEGLSFQTICEEANVEMIIPPALSLSTSALPTLPREITLQRLKDIAFSLEIGGVSDFVPLTTGGMIVRLLEREPASEEAVQAGLPEYLTELRTNAEREARAEWFRKQVETTPVIGGPWWSDNK